MFKCKEFTILITLIFLIALSFTDVHAGLILDIGISGVYEDNIDEQGRSDSYTLLETTIGGYQRSGYTTLFLLGGYAGYFFDEYDNLNVSILTFAPGASHMFNKDMSMRIIGKLKIKGYAESAKDSFAYGLGIRFKQWITPKFTLKEGYEYESNHADDSLYSYRAHLLSIKGTTWLAKRTSLDIGYAYRRKYQDNGSTSTDSGGVPFSAGAYSNSVMGDGQGASTGSITSEGFSTAHIFSAGLRHRLSTEFSLNLGLAHQINITGEENYRNNLFYAGLSYGLD